METDLELSVKDVLEAGLSTGHAESYSDLVTELLWQVAEFRARIAEIEQERDEAVERATMDWCVLENLVGRYRLAIEQALEPLDWHNVHSTVASMAHCVDGAKKILRDALKKEEEINGD